MPKTKPDTTAPAIAAHQAVWHAKQAASYWKESERHTLSVRGRETARKRFLEHTRLALPTAGLDTYLDWFRQLTSEGTRDEAAPIIRELWQEHVAKQAGAEQPLPATPDARAKLQAARQLLTLIGEQIDAALAEPQSDNAIETRKAG
jgi:hypothetical protein